VHGEAHQPHLTGSEVLHLGADSDVPSLDRLDALLGVKVGPEDYGLDDLLCEFAWSASSAGDFDCLTRRHPKIAHLKQHAL
jgi:hypothetical protein